MTAAAIDNVQVGRVSRPHGVRGEVVVIPDSDVPGRFRAGAELDLVTAGRSRPVKIETVRPHRGVLLVRFAGVEDRDAAEGLRGALLEVSSSRTPPAGDGSYYFFELVGCLCRDRTHGELGRVADVLEDGGGLLLCVARGEGTLLVPFVHRYLVAVDRQRQTIDLDLPEGLIETCASPS